MPELSRTLRAIVPEADRRSYQFSSILGDLQHKQDVYLSFLDYGKVPEAYLTNEHQAYFLTSRFPELVPPPASPGQPPSDHTLGTVFEFHYYSNLSFRLAYLRFVYAREPPLPSFVDALE